jgi:hypothetical protein
VSDDVAETAREAQLSLIGQSVLLAKEDDPMLEQHPFDEVNLFVRHVIADRNSVDNGTE